MTFAGKSPLYALLTTAVALLAAPISVLASGACFVAGLGVLYFHRDPVRTPPASGIVAPADGVVKVIREEDAQAGNRVRLGIYMSGWDVHVNRAPADGVVEAVDHVPGANRLAFTKESDSNERQRIEFENYAVEQVAGAFARRTYAYVEPGDRVERGQRVGHISFGSRVDVVLPPEYDADDLTVARGHRLYAGETVVAAESPATPDEVPERDDAARQALAASGGPRGAIAHRLSDWLAAVEWR